MTNSISSDNIGDISNSIEVSNSKITLENMNNFDTRKSTIDKIISDILSKEKFTVNINLENVNIDQNLVKRFILELLPRLKEIGGKIVITNNLILDNDFLIENKLS